MLCYEAIGPDNRARVNAYIEKGWGGTTRMVVHGECFDLATAAGLCVLDGDEVVGVACYDVRGETGELLLLDVAREGQGIGSALIAQVAQLCRDAGCKRLTVTTTNDNLGALRLYQRRGFDLIALRRNALEETRKIKPQVPLVGEYGILLRHELELEMGL